MGPITEEIMANDILEQKKERIQFKDARYPMNPKQN